MDMVILAEMHLGPKMRNSLSKRNSPLELAAIGAFMLGGREAYLPHLPATGAVAMPARILIVVAIRWAWVPHRSRWPSSARR